MLKYISTFYALQQMSNDEWSGQPRARSALTQLAGQMSLCFRDYLYMACLGEARHARKQIGAGFEGFDCKSRAEVFEDAKEYAASPENLNRLALLFETPGWSSSFGGRKWARLVHLAKEYGVLSDALFVDAVVNAQHNSGTVFNKVEAATFMDIDLSTGKVELNSLLNYRRQAANYLAEVVGYSRRLTLSAGRLAMLYSTEKRFRFIIERFIPLAEATYTPVAWGTADLPPLTEKRGKGKDDEDDDDEHEDDEYESNTARCPVCLGLLSGLSNMNLDCGAQIHSDCLYDHAQVCPDCHKQFAHLEDHVTKRCVVCHKPLTSWQETWSFKNQHDCVHKFCYWQQPEKAYSENEIEESKQLFDNFGVLCTECHLPVLKCEAAYAEGYQHVHCYNKNYQAGLYGTVCHCSDCEPTNEKWKELFDDTHAETETRFQQQEADVEVHEYIVSQDGVQEVPVQVKAKEQAHVPSVEFAPVDSPDDEPVQAVLAVYLHASPALS